MQLYVMLCHTNLISNPRSVVHMNNCKAETLEFADGSVFKGQVWDSKGQTSTKPHGYGRMINKDGFIVEAYWYLGKVNGYGRLLAPNGDIFFGEWLQHKRCGRGIQLRASDQLYLVEIYADGKLSKRMRRADQKRERIHWRLIPVPIAPSPELPPFEAPPPLQGHAMARVGSTVFMFGGVTHTDGKEICNNDVWLLGTDTNTWKRIQPSAASDSDIPPPMHGHTATAVDSRIYIIGGRQGMEVYGNVYCFDMSTGRWSCLLRKGINMAHHSAALHWRPASLGGQSAARGRSSQSFPEIVALVHGEVFVFDIDRNEWRQPEVDCSNLVRARRRMDRRRFPQLQAPAICTVEHALFVFGGKTASSTDKGGAIEDGYHAWERCSADLFSLDLLTWQWSLLDDVTGYDPAALLDNNYQTAESELQALNSGIVACAQPSWQTGRCEHTMVHIAPHYLYVVGGYTTAAPQVNVVDSAYLADVQVFDLSAMSWLPVVITDRLFLPRSLHSCAVGNDEQIFIYGGCNHANNSISELSVLSCGVATIGKIPPPAAVLKSAAPALDSTEPSTPAVSVAVPAPTPSPAPVAVAPAPVVQHHTPFVAPSVSNVAPVSVATPAAVEPLYSRPLAVPVQHVAQPVMEVAPSAAPASSVPASTKPLVGSASPDILQYFKRLYGLQI